MHIGKKETLREIYFILMDLESKGDFPEVKKRKSPVIYERFSIYLVAKYW